MTVKMTLAALGVVVITNSASAQLCENGVCRIPTRSSNQLTDRQFQDRRNNDRIPAIDQYEARHNWQRYRPAAYPSRIGRTSDRFDFRNDTVLGRPSAQACLNCDCDGVPCSCGPNCPPHGSQSRRSRDDYQRNTWQRPNDLNRRLPRSFDAATSTNRRRQQNFRPVSYNSSAAWHSDFEQATSASRQSGRPMLVKVGADWCGFCQRMDRETFTDRSLLNRIAEDFVAVELNADQNRELMQRMRIKSLPTVLVMTPQLRIAHRSEGFRTANQLTQTLQPFLQNAELDTEFHIAELR